MSNATLITEVIPTPAARNVVDLACLFHLNQLDTGKPVQMNVTVQRELFGVNVLGLKAVVIDTDNLMITWDRSLCFGNDWERYTLSFQALLDMATKWERWNPHW